MQTPRDVKTSTHHDTHARPHLAAGVHSKEMLASQGRSHTWAPEEFFGMGYECNIIRYQI